MSHGVHDVFRFLGVGLNAMFVRELLDQKRGTSVAELTDDLHLPRETIRRSLLKLEEAGLVEQRSDLLWYLLEKDLDLVAEELGISGAADRQRIRHAKERASFRQSQRLKKVIPKEKGEDDEHRQG